MNEILKLVFHVKSLVCMLVEVILNSIPLFCILPIFCHCEVKPVACANDCASNKSFVFLIKKSAVTFKRLSKKPKSTPKLTELEPSHFKLEFLSCLGVNTVTVLLPIPYFIFEYISKER